MCTVHSTLYIVECNFYSVHCILNSVDCGCDIPTALPSASSSQWCYRPWAAVGWECFLWPSFPFWFGPLCTVNSVQCTVYSILCTVNSVKSTVYSVQCAVCPRLVWLSVWPRVCSVQTWQSLHKLRGRQSFLKSKVSTNAFHKSALLSHKSGWWSWIFWCPWWKF